MNDCVDLFPFQNPASDVQHLVYLYMTGPKVSFPESGGQVKPREPIKSTNTMQIVLVLVYS